MRFEELGLRMGDLMQLQLTSDSEVRYPVKLIGYVPGCSIIISAPYNRHDGMVFVRELQAVTLRFVVNGVASGFSAKVLAMRTTPKPYLHVEIPEDIQTVEVRQALLVNTRIYATVINETRKSHSLKVTVTHLSILGGMLECDRKIALIKDELSLTMTLSMDGIERIATLNIIIVKKHQREAGSPRDGDENSNKINVYSFEFKGNDEDDVLLLKAFVYQEILRSLHMI